MQKRYSTVLKALAGLAFGLALTATAAQAQYTNVNQICLWNRAGFNVKMRVTWNGGASAWESDSFSTSRCFEFDKNGVPRKEVYPTDPRAEVKVYAIVQVVNGQTLDCKGENNDVYHNVGKDATPQYYNIELSVFGLVGSRGTQKCYWKRGL